MEMFYPKDDPTNPYPVRVVYYGPTSLIIEDESKDYIINWNRLGNRYEGTVAGVYGYIYEE